MTPEAVAALVGTWGYPLYLLLFLATAGGSPLPEDLLLLVGGYMVGAGLFDWPVVMPVAFAGVLTSDLLVYWMGRKVRSRSLQGGWVARLVRPGRLRVAARWFARVGERAIFISRLVPGTRAVVFLSAGMCGVTPGRFLLYDAAGAVLWVPLLMLLGERFGSRIGDLSEGLAKLGVRVWIVIALVATAFVIRRVALRVWQGRVPEAR